MTKKSKTLLATRSAPELCRQPSRKKQKDRFDRRPMKAAGGWGFHPIASGT